MGEIVIMGYRAKPGCEAELHALTTGHVQELRALGLATDRLAITMRAADGTIIEVFEWCDGGIATAHEHPQVQAMWGRYAEVCDYVALADLPEFTGKFAQFVALAN